MKSIFLLLLCMVTAVCTSCGEESEHFGPPGTSENGDGNEQDEVDERFGPPGIS